MLSCRDVGERSFTVLWRRNARGDRRFCGRELRCHAKPETLTEGHVIGLHALEMLDLSPTQVTRNGETPEIQNEPQEAPLGGNQVACQRIAEFREARANCMIIKR